MSRGIGKGGFRDVEVEVGDTAWPHSHHEESEGNPGVGDAGHRCRFKR